MENFDQNFDLIQQYIDGELSAEKRARVEQRLEQEVDFAQLYQRSKAAIQVIRDDAEQSTMAFLDQLHDQEIQEDFKASEAGKIRRLPLRRILSIAAVLLLLITAGIWLFRPQDESLRAFNSYYETPDLDITRGIDTDALLTEVASAYNAGNFALALEKIEKYQASGEAEIPLDLYKAVALLETDRTEAAIDILTTLKTRNFSLDQVYWLSAMSNLKMGNKMGAIEDLETLLAADFPVTNARKTKANEVLKRIR